MSSRAVKALGFSTVEYNPCVLGINDYEVKTSCISNNFIPKGYVAHTIGRLLEKSNNYKGRDELFEHMYAYDMPEDRLEFVLKSLQNYLPRALLMTSFAEYIWLDSLLLNTDRHVYNMVLITNQHEYRFINFDYGMSLLSDLEEFPMQMPLHKAVSSATSKPFSSQFSIQLELFNMYIQRSPKTDISINIGDLTDYYPLQYINRAMEVLKQRLLLNGISCTFLTSIAVVIYSTNAGKLQQFSSLINYDMRGMYYVTTFIKDKTALSDCFKFDNNERAINFCLNNPNEVVAYVPNW